MATMTNEEIQQKKQLLAEKIKEVNSILSELKEAGAIELKDEELDQATGSVSLFNQGGGDPSKDIDPWLIKHR